jgi:hypothetical protein
MDTGSERITDPAELHEVRHQARLVQIKSVVTSAIVTAIVAMV